MPEGIAPELLIVAGLLAVIVAAFFVGRRDRGETPEEDVRRAVESPGQPMVVAPPEVVVEEEAAPPEEIVLDEPAVAAPAEVEAPPRPTLRERLGKSRRFFADRVLGVFSGVPDEETWDDVEAALIQADIGVNTATRIVDDLRTKAKEQRVQTEDDVRALLAQELVSLFDRELDRGLAFAPEGVTVWLVVGVNGTGKTTTIGKLARDLSERGRTVALAAADTFRAAADEQLDVWAARSNAQVVKHQPGADPGAVAYDAHAFARARGLDVLIVDTAGRLHTKTPLMDELSKVRRVLEKETQIDEALLVIDATAGQNGLVQAKEFAAAAGVTGIVLTKLDGTAKGGIALAIENTLSIPIKLIGVGEGIDDLEPFDPKTFVDALGVKVLVAGGTGFLGRYITRALLDDGHDVTVLSRHPDAAASIPQLRGAASVMGDVTNPRTLAGTMDGAEAVVGAVQFPNHPVEVPRKGLTYDQFDRLGTERLLDAAQEAGVGHYFYVSGAGATPFSDRSWYRAKGRAEESIRKSGLAYAILRPSWAYGPEDKALNKLVKIARFSPVVPRLGFGSQRIQPVYAGDIGRAAAEIFKQEAWDRTFEIGGPDILTMDEVIKTMLRASGRRRLVVPLPATLAKLGTLPLTLLPRPFMTPQGIEFAIQDGVVDNSAIGSLGVRPVPLEEGLEYLRRVR